MEDLIFSIIIPLYNKENHIERAVKSVLKQELKIFELIIVNDGSTDNSLKVAKELTAKDRRVTVIDQVNSGVSIARNVGVAKANGKFVCFLDADDEWESSVLTEFNLLVQKCPNKSLYSCRYREITQSHVLHDNNKSIVNMDSNFSKLMCEIPNLICSSSVCIKKEKFMQVKGFPEGVAIGEDIYLWFILAGNENYLPSNKCLVSVHKDSDNRSIGSLRNNIPHILKKYYIDDEFSDTKDDGWFKKYITTKAILYSMTLVMRKERKSAFKYSKMVFRKDFKLSLFILFILCLPSRLYETMQKVRDKYR